MAVGTCLSGGIDSSTLTVLINTLIRSEAPESVGARQKTFSVVFSDTKFDESRYIDEVVAATGVDADRTEPAPDQLWDDIDRGVYLQDEPFGSLSIYAQYCVMRLAAKKVKVVLDGQGADELIAGYLGYQGSYIRGLLRTYHWGRHSVRSPVASESTGIFQSARQQLHVRRTRRGSPEVYPGNDRPVPGHSRRGPAPGTPLHQSPGASPLRGPERDGIFPGIPVPYLDVRLVEYVASLPLSQKVRACVTKVALRTAIRGKVPESVRCRRDKMGFVTPEECWMKNESAVSCLRFSLLRVSNPGPYPGMPGRLPRIISHSWRADQRIPPEIWRIACAELSVDAEIYRRPCRCWAGIITGAVRDRVL